MQLKRYLAPALLGATLLGACADDPTSAPSLAPEPARVLGLVEIRLDGVGTPFMRASMAPVGSPNKDLTPVAGGTPAGSIQLERISATTVDVGTRGNGGVRYIQAVFKVRNADASGNAYDTPRQNLTFLPVGVSNTIGGTPVRRFLKQDGLPADSGIAMHLMPTGAVGLDGGGTLVSQYPDVVQAYSESEAAGFSLPGAVTNKLPYGFVVRNVADSTTRTLPASPAAGQFDGRVTFAYSIPLAATAAEDPFSISIITVAMDDPMTRVTQSKEEQGLAGVAAFHLRAAALGAQQVTLFPGGTYTGAAPMVTLCDVRVSGTIASPSDKMGACPAPLGELELVCRAYISNGSVDCDSNANVVLTPSNATASDGVLQFDMTVQNLLPEGLGTPDGVLVDVNAIPLVFTAGPKVTGGTGTVAVLDADAVSEGRPLYRYNQKLVQNEVSAAKTWKLAYSAGVTNVEFTVKVDAVLQPMLVINEVMTNPLNPDPANPSLDTDREWFEVYNAGRFPVQMEGMLIADSAASGRRPYHRIASPLLVPSGGYVVLGSSTNTVNNGGVPVDYSYGGSIAFANSLDALKISRLHSVEGDTLTLDRTQFANAATSAQAGISRELLNPALDNSNMDGSNWGNASVTAVYGNGGRGTPKAQNSTYTP